MQQLPGSGALIAPDHGGQFEFRESVQTGARQDPRHRGSAQAELLCDRQHRQSLSAQRNHRHLQRLGGRRRSTPRSRRAIRKAGVALGLITPHPFVDRLQRHPELARYLRPSSTLHNSINQQCSTVPCQPRILVAVHSGLP